MKKTLFLLFLVIMLSFMLSSCGFSGVDNDQIIADIALRDEVQNCYNSQLTDLTEYHVKEFEIVKEQLNKDSKQDLIYGNATIENEHFSVNFNMEAVYNYYEKGGWIMDEFSMSDIQATPIALPNIENIESALLQTYDNDSITANYEQNSVTLDYGKLTLTEAELFDMGKELEKSVNESNMNSDYYRRQIDFIQENNITYAKLNAQYISPVLTVNGYYYMAFVDNEWCFSFQTSGELDSNNTDNSDNANSPSKSVVLTLDKEFYITDYQSDYSKAIGTYKLFTGNGESVDIATEMYSKSKGDITIHNISDKTIELTLNYEFNDANEQCYLTVPTGEKMTQDFNVLEGSLVIAHSYGNPGHLKYNPITNVWVSHGTGDEFSQSDDAMISITFCTVQFNIDGDGGLSAPEYYIDDELVNYTSLRVPSNGRDITIKNAIDECITNLVHEVYNYSEDGKKLISAYGLDENNDGGHWRCYINGELLSLDDYCNHPVKYGDEVKMVFVFNELYELYYHNMGYYEQYDMYVDDYFEKYGEYPFDIKMFDKYIYRALYPEE